MIAESSYWKDDLLKHAKSLRRRKKQQRWSDVSFARFEQTIMLGFYSVRKLIEAKKLSNSTINRCIKIMTYPWKGKGVITTLNWHHIDRFYDLGTPTVESLKLEDMCNQIVHSFVFRPSFCNCPRLNGILFTSDYRRLEKLQHADIDVVIDLFEHIGRDYPDSGSMNFNMGKKDWDVEMEMAHDKELLK